MKNKVRLDILLANLGLCKTRSQAQGLILSGKVIVNGQVITKCGSLFSIDTSIELKEDFPYVSRGALKLIKALDTLPVKVEGKVVADIGSSTGGFTQVLLERGASHIYSIDVGTNQLDYSLRKNPKVTVMENTNARYLKPDIFELKPELAVIDVSFISLRLIIPALKNIIFPCNILCLVKPQFEIGKEIPHFDGVVRKKEDQFQSVLSIYKFCLENDLIPIAACSSPIPGPKGNLEYFIFAKDKFISEDCVQPAVLSVDELREMIFVN